MKDRDVLFHEKWLGLAQPIEGLVFSVPVLADAQIAPELRPGLSAAFAAHVDDQNGAPRIRSLERFFRDFLGYEKPGMLVPRAELPADLSFYAAEGGQELRPSFALGRGPFDSDDPFAIFEQKASPPSERATADAGKTPWTALLWDLTEAGPALDLDAAEAVTGPWRYPPTAKLERLLRHAGVPVGLLFNGRELRLVYAPTGESTAHLTFRIEHMVRPDGRPLLAALDLLLHARRAYAASREHTLEGLLLESRRRQADVTDALAKQVFEAVEILLAGFEAAAARDIGDGAGERLDWLRAALEEEGDHFYQGVLSVVLRLVFLLYAEDKSLLPVEHPTFAEHLSLFGLYERLSHDAGAHPESMHHRFGAYGQLLSLFRTVFFGVKHGSLELPPRHGRLFDPNAFPFIEGGLPGWTSAVVDPEARAAARPPSVDDGTVHLVMRRLVLLAGQRLSYQTLDVEQLGSVYESLMGYRVIRLTSSAVRVGKFGVWVQSGTIRALDALGRTRLLKETCGLDAAAIQSLEQELATAEHDDEIVDALSASASGRNAETARHRAVAGRLVLQPSEQRRRTASHYTPRFLTEKVVRRTLEPVLECLGSARTPEQILQLKICDPAMGSGAFLVATVRALAAELVEAWERRSELAKIIESFGDAHLHARRLVAQRCVYGVDRNPIAVELAKLSLWLVTLSRKLPFTFVDHALRHGDSLVGLDFRQIAAFDWSPDVDEPCREVLRDALEEAIALRQRILELAESEDVATQAEKRRLLKFAEEASARVRMLADACVGAYFDAETDAARAKERKRRRGLIEQWLASRDHLVGDVEERGRSALRELERLANKTRSERAPFHWWLEFPEVFFAERVDPLEGGRANGAALMEAAVGNPPFMGGSRLTTEQGAAYSAWLAREYAPATGQTDLCAYFFRRVARLIGAHGACGMIATNSIAQGDTAASGLAVLVREGFSVYAAERSLPWPGKANVIVSIVHLAKGAAADRAPPSRLDGVVVETINAKLEPKATRGAPVPLRANKGVAGLGVRIDGPGFLIPAGAAEVAEYDDARRRGVLRPYVGGDDLNNGGWSHPIEYVIDFHALDESTARGEWPKLFRQAESVKAARVAKGRSEGWWRFPIPRFYASYGDSKREVLAAPIYAKHLIWSFVPGSVCLNSKVFVYESANRSRFAVLQSRIHEAWAWANSSTLKLDLAYSAQDAFQTFPFPLFEAAEVALDAAGERLIKARAAVAAALGGLTKTYNALGASECRDEAVETLRVLHEEMDRAVLDAYGWSDLRVPPYCPRSDEERQAVKRFEDDLIDRLSSLNAMRAGEEGDAERRAPAIARPPRPKQTPGLRKAEAVLPTAPVRRRLAGGTRRRSE